MYVCQCWCCVIDALVASLVSADPCWPCTLSLPLLLVGRDCHVERCHTGATLGCRRQWHFSQQKCFSQQVTHQPSYQFKYTCTHSSILTDIFSVNLLAGWLAGWHLAALSTQIRSYHTWRESGLIGGPCNYSLDLLPSSTEGLRGPTGLRMQGTLLPWCHQYIDVDSQLWYVLASFVC